MRSPYIVEPSLPLTGKPRPGTAFDSVLGKYNNDKLGAFPLGEVSLIQGASGTGKTTIGVDMLRTQARGEEYLSCETFRRTFLVMMLDRSAKALVRTFYAMEMSMDDFPFYVLSSEDEQTVPADVVREKLNEQHRDVIFIEGLDIWAKQPSDGSVVAAVMGGLQKVAEHYHCAIIATVGAPKAKPKEMYKAPRDRSIGSSLWARKAETIMDIMEDHETEERQVSLLVRSCKPRKITMVFDERSRLVPKEPSISVGPEGMPPTSRELGRLLGVSHNTAARYIKDGTWGEKIPGWARNVTARPLQDSCNGGVAK